MNQTKKWYILEKNLESHNSEMRADMNKNMQDKNIRDISFSEKTNTLVGTRQRRLVDEQTGEVMEVTQTTKLRYGSTHFWKCYMKKFLEVMKSLNSKQFKVFIYIIEHTNSSTNQFVGTYDKIVKDTKCCRQTVTVAMKVLQKTNFIKKIQNGVWMVNPEILLKGNDAKQFMLMSNFKSASSEMKKKDES